MINFHLSDENDSTVRNQNYMDYYMAEDDESSASHSPKTEQDVKPFNQDNKSLLVLALDSMTNITQVIYEFHLLLPYILFCFLHLTYSKYRKIMLCAIAFDLFLLILLVINLKIGKLSDLK